MKIDECILDDGNGFAVGGSTVGALIKAAGKRHLWDQRAGGVVDTVVVHYMSAVNVTPGKPYDLGQLLKIFCDYGVSAHYLIDREGNIRRLVPEEMRAWHAGASIMPEPDNRKGANEFAIGIELMATAKSGFTDAQYNSLAELCKDIEKRRSKKMTYVGHDQIAGKRAVDMKLRADAKPDPGPLFDWGRFMGGLRK